MRAWVMTLGLWGCGEDVGFLPCTEPGTICRVAGWGNGTNGFNGEDAIATQSLLYYPSALAVDPDGRLVVDDFNNMRIRVLQHDGTLVDIAGSGFHDYSIEGVALDSPLENPVDVALAEDGTIFVAELHAHRVLRVDLSGDLTWYAGTGDEGFSGDGGPAREALLASVSGVAVTPDGAVYVSDSENHRIRRVNVDGTIETVAGDGEAGLVDGVGAEARFTTPQRIRASPDGTLLIGDYGNHTIRRLDPDSGEVSTIAGTGIGGLDGDGGPAVDASFNGPTSAWEADDGTIWVADSLNNVVRRIAADGTVETVAGNGEPGFEGENVQALEANLNYPADVRIGSDGRLYIADLKSGMVRCVVLEGL